MSLRCSCGRFGSRGVLCALAIAVIPLAASSSSAQTIYRIVDLGDSIAFDVNDCAVVVGGRSGADRWQRSGVNWNLVGYDDPPGTTASAAMAINDLGAAAGQLFNDVLEGPIALQWPTNAVGVPFAFVYGIAWDVNDAGAIVGQMGQSNTMPFVAQGELAVPLSAQFGFASGINESNQIVGLSFNPATRRNEAALWQMVDAQLQTTYLGTLGGSQAVANDINEAGLAVGSANNADEIEHAFYWDGRQLVDMGTLGGETSCAYAANDNGVIVGVAETEAGVQHAFMWIDGTMIDLNDLDAIGDDLELIKAYGINNRGHIVGEARNAAGQTRAFIFVQPIFGDVNQDGFVDASDLGFLLGAWSMPASASCSGAMQCQADLTGDTLVNASDLALLLGAWTIPACGTPISE